MHRKRPGRCPLLFALLLPALLALVLGGCNDNGGATSSTISGGGGSAKPAHLQFQVGEEATVGGVTVLVPTLMPTMYPSAPQFPDATGVGFSLAGNEIFCQVFVKVKNGGDSPVRVDPADFTLDMPGAALMDRARSGPSARTLIPGTSLDLILTFVVTEGSSPRLVYRPSWFNGTLTFSGERGPLGVR